MKVYLQTFYLCLLMFIKILMLAIINFTSSIFLLFDMLLLILMLPWCFILPKYVRNDLITLYKKHNN